MVMHDPAPATRPNTRRTGGVVRPEAIFRALSDSTRLRLLSILIRNEEAGADAHRRRCGTGGVEPGEVCVCDLTRAIGAPQPTISRHLAYLRRTGLVQQRKNGLWSYYRLAPPRSKLHAGALECLRSCRGEICFCIVNSKTSGSCCVRPGCC
jgi:ArsR family transcriptional regulator